MPPLYATPAAGVASPSPSPAPRGVEWSATLHRAELEADWRRARQGLPLARIPSLDWDRSLLRIRSVTPLDGRRVRLGLTDGSERTVDLSPFLRGPVFEAIACDRGAFEAVRVDPELGTLVWPNGADLDPDVLIHGRAPAGA